MQTKKYYSFIGRRDVIPWRLLTGACVDLFHDLAHRLFDHGRFQLTFPDHDHVPTGIPQNAVILRVSGFVCADLVLPKFDI